MKTIAYTGGGSLSVGGCSGVTRHRAIPYQYSEGSTLYVLAKAQEGVLEKLVIKRVNLVQSVPIYVDTFNWLWNEGELTDEATAIALARDYLLGQQQVATAGLCGSPTP